MNKGARTMCCSKYSKLTFIDKCMVCCIFLSKLVIDKLIMRVAALITLSGKHDLGF